MLSENVPITLVVVCITPLSLVVASFLAKRSYGYFQSQSAVRGEQTALVNEMIEGQKVVQAFGHEAESLTAFDEVNGRLQDVSLKAIFFSSLTNPATRFVNNIVYAGVGLVGAVYAVRGGITIGQLSVFLSYANQYTKPFNEISGVVTELQNALACAARVFELLDAGDQVPEVENASVLQPDGHVQLENVSFRYPGAEADTLHGIDLTVHPGERLAVVGLNGAGKTTLVKLLCGFYDPTEGRVLLNGEDIREFNRQEYYTLFTAVFQKFSVLEATLEENVAQTREGIDEARVRECLEKAGLTERVAALPDDLKTHIGREVFEDGVLLSGGEMQRLMLARALYKNAPILLLDEPTAALDPIAENDIYQKYAAMTVGRTSVFISHRLASTRFCDRILLIDGGVIAEQGSHEELLARGGKYAGLFEVQSKYYREEGENDGRE